MHHGLAAQSDPAELTGLAGFVAEVVSALGPVGVFVLTVLETVFPPVPSELFLPLAGFLASRDQMPLAAAMVAATLGSVAGALILYGAGARFGQRRIDSWLKKIPLVEQQDLDKGQNWFRRHGAASVFFGRFVPGVRSVVSIPAGLERMPLGRFLLYTTAGSAGWNALLISAGYLLGSAWQSIGRYSDYLNYALYAAAAFLIARFVWRHRDRLPMSQRHRG